MAAPPTLANWREIGAHHAPHLPGEDELPGCQRTGGDCEPRKVTGEVLGEWPAFSAKRTDHGARVYPAEGCRAVCSPGNQAVAMDTQFVVVVGHGKVVPAADRQSAVDCEAGLAPLGHELAFCIQAYG
mgnify:CR=1 FL=1